MDKIENIYVLSKTSRDSHDPLWESKDFDPDEAEQPGDELVDQGEDHHDPI